MRFPGEEISAKISRMELIVEKIFEAGAEASEIIPDLKKLMNYYASNDSKAAGCM